MSVLDDRGLRSPTTTVPVSGSGPGCTDRRPAAECIAAAEALFQRCIEGSAPRERCHPEAWRRLPPLPIEPLRNVTSETFEASLRATVDRMRSPQAAPVEVSCPELPRCEVTWQTPGQAETRFTVGYRMSGSAGCWTAVRHQTVNQPAHPGALHTLEAWGNAFIHPSGCTARANR